MKIFALVELSGIRHMVDDRGEADGIRAEAAARGVRLIMMRPMEEIIEADRLAAISRWIKQGTPGTDNDLGEMIMSALDDLKAVVTALKDEVADSSAKFKALADKLAATPAGNDEEIKAITEEIRTTTAALDAATADKPAEPAPGPPPA